MFITEQWWSSLSSRTLVSTGSWNISDHLENGLLVVIIVDSFSYRLAMRLKNRLAESNGSSAVSDMLLSGSLKFLECITFLWLSNPQSFAICIIEPVGFLGVTFVLETVAMLSKSNSFGTPPNAVTILEPKAL